MHENMSTSQNLRGAAVINLNNWGNHAAPIYLREQGI
jgi:hypothetical protein